MDREILFRGFNKCGNGTQIAVVNGKEYRGEWVEGCYVYDNNLNQNIRAFDNCYYAVIPETVCELTGLTDKNEKKIFEHDRVKYKCGDIAEVIFTEYGAFVGETESLSHENIGGVLTEVIGTIFDKEEV